METLEDSAIRLIDRLYKNLYLSSIVLKYKKGNKFQKFQNIKDFFSKLEDIERELISKNHIGFLKEIFYSKYLIKEENIPNSYFELKRKIAFEKGYGHIDFSKGKKRIIEEIIDNQKKSLDIWLDYFLSNDSNNYPFWAKYWAFQGMLKIGTYDFNKEEYKHRSLDTTSPFIELNKESLNLTIEYLIKYLQREEISDKNLENIVKTGSFFKIYTYFLKNIIDKQKVDSLHNEGMWVRFKKGSDPIELVNRIEGYNTNWCTVSLSIAREQLALGDFYIFFTLSKNNEYEIPRIAIRMEDENIAEVRGVGKDQDVEAELESVLEDVLKTYFKDDRYYQKLEDMKTITKIYNKNHRKEELSIEELRILYQLDKKIIGFGYDGDIRIGEIIKSRDIKEDLSRIFNCKYSEVKTNFEEIDLNTKVYYGNIKILDDNLLITPKIIVGNIEILNWKDRNNINFLTEKVYGDVEVTVNETLENITFPREIYGKFSINCFLIDDAKLLNIHFPDYIRNNFECLGAVYLKDSILPSIINGNTKLFWFRKMENVKLPNRISEDRLNLSNLKDISGLILPINLDYDIETRYEVINRDNKEYIKRKSLK